MEDIDCKYELWTKSEIARALTDKSCWDQNDVVTMAVECANLLGKAYIYERRIMAEGKDYRKIYVLGKSPVFERVISPRHDMNCQIRVDGSNNDTKILGTCVVNYHEKDLKPNISKLLKKADVRVTIDNTGICESTGKRIIGNKRINYPIREIHNTYLLISNHPYTKTSKQELLLCFLSRI